MRVPQAVIVTFALALVILLAPRSIVGPLLSTLREPTVPALPVASSSLESAYPPDLFLPSRVARVTAPVFALGIGPYRHDLKLALGSSSGIAPGATVIVSAEGSPNVLVGRVRDAGASSAVVETISSPEWKSAVRIGTSSVDALLVGGLSPMLTLIPKGAPIAEGDAVVSADAAFPYGLVVGTVTDLRDAEDGVLREATLATPYALSGLRAVDVMMSGDAR
jgi:cell shape-determining protein MreC